MHIARVLTVVAIMPRLETQIDAGFYRLVHHLIEASMDSPQWNRRSDSRLPYACLQLVAPYDGHNFPADDQFFGVQCQNLTGGGFSFLLDHRPTFELLVADFQRCGAPLYVAARVLHCQAAATEPAEDANQADRGPTRFLVGCQFLHRLARPRTTG